MGEMIRIDTDRLRRAATVMIALSERVHDAQGLAEGAVRRLDWQFEGAAAYEHHVRQLVAEVNKAHAAIERHKACLLAVAERFDRAERGLVAASQALGTAKSSVDGAHQVDSARTKSAIGVAACRGSAYEAELENLKDLWTWLGGARDIAGKWWDSMSAPANKDDLIHWLKKFVPKGGKWQDLRRFLGELSVVDERINPLLQWQILFDYDKYGHENLASGEYDSVGAASTMAAAEAFFKDTLNAIPAMGDYWWDGIIDGEIEGGGSSMGHIARHLWKEPGTFLLDHGWTWEEYPALGRELGGAFLDFSEGVADDFVGGFGDLYNQGHWLPRASVGLVEGSRDYLVNPTIEGWKWMISGCPRG